MRKVIPLAIAGTLVACSLYIADDSTQSPSDEVVERGRHPRRDAGVGDGGAPVDGGSISDAGVPDDGGPISDGGVPGDGAPDDGRCCDPDGGFITDARY